MTDWTAIKPLIRSCVCSYPVLESGERWRGTKGFNSANSQNKTWTVAIKARKQTARITGKNKFLCGD